MTEKLLIACLYSVVINMSLFFGTTVITWKKLNLYEKVIRSQDSGVKLSISNSSFGFN